MLERKKITRIFLIVSVFIASQLFAQQRVKIALWGDSRENANGAAENISHVLLHEITDWDFQIHTGDFTHRASDEDWQRSLNYKGMKQLFVKGKFLMCTSNHDRNQKTWDKYTRGVLPTNNLDHTTHFYSYDKGNVHVVFCDGYFTNPDTMQMWLKEDLKSVEKDDWLIGVWHPPCYDSLTYKRGYLPVSLPWLKLIYAAGGDFILHGHAHVYVRSKPLLPDGTVDEKDGMVHIVNGVGGASFSDAQPWTEKTAFSPKTQNFPCITFLTFEGNKATVQTIDVRPEKHLQVIDEWQWVR